MKKRVFLTLGLAFAVILFGSFMVREREETVNPSPDYYLLQGDKSFTVFLSNLQKMEALIYVPKTRLPDTKSFNLALVPRTKAGTINKALTVSTDDYVQVFPSDDADEAVTLNFEKMNMVCYVKQEKVNAKSMDMFLIKIENGNAFPKVEIMEINAVRPEELQLKVEGSKVMQAYVPVGIY